MRVCWDPDSNRRCEWRPITWGSDATAIRYPGSRGRHSAIDSEVLKIEAARSRRGDSAGRQPSMPTVITAA